MRVGKPFGFRRLIWIAVLLLVPACLFAQWKARREIRIPDPPGYVTLKCDFHTHTVFSDGSVWPPVRVDEAWREGLDAIALTDHIEYQPHKDDIPTNYPRPYELAKQRAAELGILLVRGAEITKGEPPGHFNALFVQDIAALKHDDYKVAVAKAVEQGAFVFWNHPGWKQHERRAVWYAQVDTLFQRGQLHGIEVVNGGDYYPNAHKWCLEKNLTMFGNSDVHAPIGMNYNVAAGELRPLTLVFAKERSLESLKEALLAHRTAVLADGKLIGREELVRPIVTGALAVKTPRLVLHGKDWSYAQVYNSSDVDFHLRVAGEVDGIVIPQEVTAWAGRTVLFRIRASDLGQSGARRVELPYEVTNVLVAPDQGLRISIPITVEFQP